MSALCWSSIGSQAVAYALVCMLTLFVPLPAYLPRPLGLAGIIVLWQFRG